MARLGFIQDMFLDQLVDSFLHHVLNELLRW